MPHEGNAAAKATAVTKLSLVVSSNGIDQTLHKTPPTPTTLLEFASESAICPFHLAL